MDSLTKFGGDLWKYYLDGGGTMHFITLLSLASLTVIFYKLVVFRQVKLDLNEFIAKLRAALLKGDLKAAMAVCEQNRSPVSAILKSGMLKQEQRRPRDEIERTMENAAIHEVAYLEKYLAVLATVTNLAPLLGFFGTVAGMIQSFDVIAAQGLNNPGAVAKGISVALLTTAWGLMVAFITQPFYIFFVGKVAAYVRQIETATNIMFETFEEMEHPEARASKAV